MKYLIAIIFALLLLNTFGQGNPMHLSTDKVDIATYDYFHYRKYDKKAGRRIGAHNIKYTMNERVDFTLDFSYNNYYLIVSTKEFPSLKIELKNVISDKSNYTKWFAHSLHLNQPWSKNFIYIHKDKKEVIFDFTTGIYRYHGISTSGLCFSDSSEIESSFSNMKISAKCVNKKAEKLLFKAQRNENTALCEAIFYAVKHQLKIPSSRKKMQLILEEKDNRKIAVESNKDKQLFDVLINKKLLR